MAASLSTAISRLSSALGLPRVGLPPRERNHDNNGNDNGAVAESMSKLKEEFLSQYKGEYGYPDGPLSIDQLRAAEFPRLDSGIVYLDHAGGTLYSDVQMQGVSSDLLSNLYGNPHSQSESSNSTSDIIASARQEVLKMFNAPEEYKCIFTCGATAALKLVGECFPWSSLSHFYYTMENHNSVLGIREYALAKGATVTPIDVDMIANGISRPGALRLRSPLKRALENDEGAIDSGCTYNLFAFPLECNFSGEKFDLELASWVQSGKHTDNPRGKWMVLLDAAKGCTTSPLDLSKYPVDFVTVSFYKMFGYPTGLGALLVKSDAAEALRKRYFGGGTVAVSVADVDFMRKRETIEQWLEDGTSSFLGIAALRYGFHCINRLGMPAISKHVGCLAKYTASILGALQHSNGTNICIIYGKHESHIRYWGENCEQGPVVTFNLKRLNGMWVGHHEIEKLASLNGINLRTGCFCNPGACSKHLNLTAYDFQNNFEEHGHVCWDDNDIIHGNPTGAVRVSFGYMSSIDESLALVRFICKYFKDDGIGFGGRSQSQESKLRSGTGGSGMYLESMTVYPIKSCAGFSVDAWPIGNCGLLYDREWILMDSSGKVMTQKKYPRMCQIRTLINLSTKKLHVACPTKKKELVIPLSGGFHLLLNGNTQLSSERPKGFSYGEAIAHWFTEALGTSCTLVKREPKSRKVSATRSQCHAGQICEKEERELSFANEGQFLLVSQASVEDLNSRLKCQPNSCNKEVENGHEIRINTSRFRPNLVVSGGGTPYDEDHWQAVSIGKHNFSVLGGCNRCQMVNIDQKTGVTDKWQNPLLALASYRRNQGNIVFGVLLVHNPSIENSDSEQDSQTFLKVGCPVIPHMESPIVT